mgnify:CR=1 FL=1
MNKINEIFYSLQGEGFYTGTPAVFVRFAGCNLHCSFCDTQHTSFTTFSDEAIVAEVLKYSATLVVLTGGEPSLQATTHLVDLLHAHGRFVSIETNGTKLPPANVDWITLSPKQGGALAYSKANELKVVFEGQDMEHFLTEIEAQHYFLQPCSNKNVKETLEYILKHPQWRLSLQTHKILNIR